ncbi:MAG: hypothetical protein ACE5Z5_05580 [Candidatus Bathyarchaeia archaeon]
METRYVPYRAKRVLNVHKHVDGGWFWNRYSAHPYVGCQHGCEYCYWRDERYNLLAREEAAQDLADPFSQYIKVKVNAPELLRKELSRVPRDIIVTGDYQPAEAEFRLSRGMLEIILELGFPVLINEKSPLVLRDLDLIREINERSWACVLWSIAKAGSEGYLEVFEPHAPPIEGRFKAMKRVSEAGVLTGTAFMPILPLICDDDENLEAVVRKTSENGGSFVLAGSLTMSGAQAPRCMSVIARHHPRLVAEYERLYRGGYSPDRGYTGTIGKKVKALCERYGIADRMPRYIQPGGHARNKEIAEKLFNEAYYMELDRESPYRIRAYRRAAWTIDELDESVETIYRGSGLGVWKPSRALEKPFPRGLRGS